VNGNSQPNKYFYLYVRGYSRYLLLLLLLLQLLYLLSIPHIFSSRVSSVIAPSRFPFPYFRFVFCPLSRSVAAEQIGISPGG
jgi:hypothetical protein